ncbi:hypothetical protein FRACA_3610004 [Frankia canadensis]|uniref:Uncharacterized protein n=1 Tax=Frankia canadensis TaxID=1836972 RepID=A0A2I2KVK2_9ACTN|nr:hypothetical protein FRACA_3610004 [Frankia canadensis]SOU56981.1 hypothetical protein FRACA_3610004 [Frankia canadensis]
MPPRLEQRPLVEPERPVPSHRVRQALDHRPLRIQPGRPGDDERRVEVAGVGQHARMLRRLPGQAGERDLPYRSTGTKRTLNPHAKITIRDAT